MTDKYKTLVDSGVISSKAACILEEVSADKQWDLKHVGQETNSLKQTDVLFEQNIDGVTHTARVREHQLNKDWMRQGAVDVKFRSTEANGTMDDLQINDEPAKDLASKDRLDGPLHKTEAAKGHRWEGDKFHPSTSSSSIFIMGKERVELGQKPSEQHDRITTATFGCITGN